MSDTADPIYVTYYTPDYWNHAKLWKLSADRWGLDYHRHQIKDLGSWQKNTHYKPTFLLECLERWPDRPVVWVDVDAVFQQRPDFSEYSCSGDVAWHTYTLSGGYREALSGTVFLNEDMDRGTSDFLREWIRLCRESPDVYDQKLMEKAGDVVFDGVDVRTDLPAELCFIHDLFRKPFYLNSHPNVGDPVIEHFQASREKRKNERAE